MSPTPPCKSPGQVTCHRPWKADAAHLVEPPFAAIQAIILAFFSGRVHRSGDLYSVACADHREVNTRDSRGSGGGLQPLGG